MRPIRIAAALVSGLFLCASTDLYAVLVGASVSPARFNCAFSGDPTCAGGQVLGDPAFDAVIDNISGASRGSVAVADKSYVDPRIGTNNSTSGSAIARIGALRAQADATVSSQPPLSTGTTNLMRLSTFSAARFQDTITLTPALPALIGTPGIMTASIAVSGALATSAVHTKASGLGFEPTLGAADWRLAIESGSTFLGGLNSARPGFFGAVGVSHAGDSTAGLGPTALVTFSLPIVFGAPTDIHVALGANAAATVNSAAVVPLTSGFTFVTAESIYTATATWNGISSVRSGATPVAFTVSSASGINYALPVPEPRMATLFALGLLLVSWRRWLAFARKDRPALLPAA